MYQYHVFYWTFIVIHFMEDRGGETVGQICDIHGNCNVFIFGLSKNNFDIYHVNPISHKAGLLIDLQHCPQ